VTSQGHLFYKIRGGAEAGEGTQLEEVGSTEEGRRGGLRVRNACPPLGAKNKILCRRQPQKNRGQGGSMTAALRTAQYLLYLCKIGKNTMHRTREGVIPGTGT